MAKNEKHFFHKGGAQGTTALTTSLADIVVGQTDDSDVTELTVVNKVANAVTLVIADETDQTLMAMSVPASAGTSTTKAIRLLQDNLIPGTQLDGFGNYIYRLLSGKKIRARAGENDALVIRWRRMDF